MNISEFKWILASVRSWFGTTCKVLYSQEFLAVLDGMCSPYTSHSSIEFYPSTKRTNTVSFVNTSNRLLEIGLKPFPGSSPIPVCLLDIPQKGLERQLLEKLGFLGLGWGTPVPVWHVKVLSLLEGFVSWEEAQENRTLVEGTPRFRSLVWGDLEEDFQKDAKDIPHLVSRLNMEIPVQIPVLVSPAPSEEKLVIV